MITIDRFVVFDGDNDAMVDSRQAVWGKHKAYEDRKIGHLDALSCVDITGIPTRCVALRCGALRCGALRYGALGLLQAISAPRRQPAHGTIYRRGELGLHVTRRGCTVTKPSQDSSLPSMRGKWLARVLHSRHARTIGRLILYVGKRASA